MFFSMYIRVLHILHTFLSTTRQFLAAKILHPQKGDIAGWVLVALMTAGIVVVIWTAGGPLLEKVFQNAVNKVSGHR